MAEGGSFAPSLAAAGRAVVAGHLLAVVRKTAIASHATLYRVERFFGGKAPGRKMMKVAGTSYTWRGLAVLLASAVLWLASAVAGADPLVKQADAGEKPKNVTAKAKEDADAKLRPIRMAIFDVDVLQNAGTDGTDIIYIEGDRGLTPRCA